jgi:multidrug resistance efflux pump
MVKLGFGNIKWLALVFLCLGGLLALWWWKGLGLTGGSLGGPDTPGVKDPGTVRLPDDAVLVVGTGEVDVDGGILSLAPPVLGVVEAVPVQEGQTIPKGTVLLRLRADAAQSQLQQAEAAVQVAMLRLEQSRDAHAQFDTDRDLLTQVVRVAQARVDAQQLQVDRARQAMQLKQLSEAEFRTAEAQLRGFQAVLEGETLRLKRFSKVESERNVQLAQANLTAAEASQKAARDALEQYTLRTPEDGKVLRLSARIGQLLWPGQPEPPVLLLPSNRPWIVRCEIDQRFADRLTVGMACDIVPYELTEPKWQGHIERLSDLFASPRSVRNDIFQTQTAGKMDCVVAIHSGSAPARVGKRVQVVFRATPSAPGMR